MLHICFHGTNHFGEEDFERDLLYMDMTDLLTHRGSMWHVASIISLSAFAETSEVVKIYETMVKGPCVY